MTPALLSVPIRRLALDTPSDAPEEQDLVAVEERVQIRVGNRDIAVTMRTPGDDAELAAGFLFTEGVVGPGDIAKVVCARNTATVTVADGVEFDDSILRRNFYVSSSCGVCGRASIGALESNGCTILNSGPAGVSQAMIRSLPMK